MARPYPREFRDDVVRVARNREDGVPTWLNLVRTFGADLEQGGAQVIG
jgi:hypothetical protein